MAQVLVEIVYQEKTFRFTASVGVATLTENDSHVRQIVALADKALYIAKAQGRDRVIISGDP